MYIDCYFIHGCAVLTICMKTITYMYHQMQIIPLLYDYMTYFFIFWMYAHISMYIILMELGYSYTYELQLL